MQIRGFICRLKLLTFSDKIKYYFSKLRHLSVIPSGKSLFDHSASVSEPIAGKVVKAFLY